MPTERTPRSPPGADEPARVRAVYAARADAGIYSPLRADQVAIAASRARVWGQLLEAAGRSLGTTLEVGSGTGKVLRWAIEAGADPAVGVDVIPERLRESRRLNPALPVLLASGLELPIKDDSVDTAICSTLFSSILDDHVARRVVDELGRVLRPGGCVLWFDFRVDNPANRHVRPMSRRAIRNLFPGWDLQLRSVVLHPPLARRLLRLPRVASLLEALPPARSHLAGLLTPPGEIVNAR